MEIAKAQADLAEAKQDLAEVTKNNNKLATLNLQIAWQLEEEKSKTCHLGNELCKLQRRHGELREPHTEQDSQEDTRAIHTETGEGATEGTSSEMKGQG